MLTKVMLHTGLMYSSFVEVDSQPQCRSSLTHNGDHVNIHSSRKPAFPSLLPYRTLLEAFVLYLKEMCVAKHKICSHAGQ
jgi:hypothetical protein